jgi:hypothetical protein
MRQADRPWIRWALALVLVGAGLRLYGLTAMEFKWDEQEALNQSMRFLDDRLWASFRTWPTHGMLSSNRVGNAPLFTWIVAGVWAVFPNPLAVAAFVAVVNVLCLYPLWLWARRHMDDFRATLTLALCAVSPFAVLFSRKIWTQDLLFPGVLSLLFGIDALRAGRTWVGVTLFLVATLVVGQLHQSGLIAFALLPLAFAAQYAIDRVSGRGGSAIGRLSWPSRRQLAILVLLVGLNLVFWVPYLDYLLHLPPTTLDERPRVDVFGLFLLRKIQWQVIPTDLFYFFEPHRDDFLKGALRSFFFQASVWLGAPLFVYGLWRWLRSPSSLPVLSVWWAFIILAFGLARIPTFPFYALILMPLPAVLAAGVFDGPLPWDRLARARDVWRVAYVAAVLGLTVTTQVWLVGRGGSAGDYGIGYARRAAQAQVLVSQTETHRPENFFQLGELRPTEGRLQLSCAPVPVEVLWIAHRIRQSNTEVGRGWKVCDTWVDRDGRLEYRWTLQP